ncbi:MAG: response regulator transcription factor [Saprospiraceae bacterium]|nr:response regulator transcription factor [Saprospiraceae bacterium]MBK7736430.1 response regulator transcription factor [Saprospiraceae bacterium]MBK7912205.1 response regulator transcription factor [Saprospiraceae bacterium]
MSEQKINILICDDHTIFRTGMKNIVRKLPVTDHIYEASNGNEAIAVAETNKVDLILLDIEMPYLNGVDTAKYFKKNHPEIRIIMISFHNDKELFLQLYKIGVEGYLVKNTSLEDLKRGIVHVLEGNQFFSAELGATVIHGLINEKLQTPKDPLELLSEREVEILLLICQQLTTDEIAAQLFISPLTVKRHRQNLLDKTNSKNIVGLILYAIRNDLLDAATIK